MRLSSWSGEAVISPRAARGARAPRSGTSTSTRAKTSWWAWRYLTMIFCIVQGGFVRDFESSRPSKTKFWNVGNRLRQDRTGGGICFELRM
eukprot:3782714-Pyramimonas_sp.AAC.1